MDKLIAESYEEFLNEQIKFKKLTQEEIGDFTANGEADKKQFKPENVSFYWFKTKNKWNYSVYFNDKNQILVWGNPEKGMGEDIRYLKGGQKEAEEEIKKIKQQ